MARDFSFIFTTAEKRSMNSVLSFKSDQPSTETGPEAAAAAEQTSALWPQGGNRPFAFLQANLYVEITEGRHFPKLFLMHDIKLWPCGIERPNSNL